MRVKITLVLMEITKYIQKSHCDDLDHMIMITLDRVKTTLVSVENTLFVWKSYFECKSHTRASDNYSLHV
jgi:hypothetical protein